MGHSFLVWAIGGAIHELMDEKKKRYSRYFEEEIIQLIECSEWERIIKNWWFIVSNLDSLEKTCHLAYLKGRDNLGGNKELSFRHVQSSLRRGRGLS